MLTILKPGLIVKHYVSALHYGVQMEIVAVHDHKAMVAFTNACGVYEERWISQDELDLFEETDFPFAASYS